jgi:hypothetical protein
MNERLNANTEYPGAIVQIVKSALSIYSYEIFDILISDAKKKAPPIKVGPSLKL